MILSVYSLHILTVWSVLFESTTTISSAHLTDSRHVRIFLSSLYVIMHTLRGRLIEFNQCLFYVTLFLKIFLKGMLPKFHVFDAELCQVSVFKYGLCGPPGFCTIFRGGGWNKVGFYACHVKY